MEGLWHSSQAWPKNNTVSEQTAFNTKQVGEVMKHHPTFIDMAVLLELPDPDC